MKTKKGASQEQKENVKIARKTFKTLQPKALDKENLAGRNILDKLGSSSKSDLKLKDVECKAVQTGEVTEGDLTSEEPSIDYWQKLAEKRQESLNESLHEIEQLKENIDALKEENKICKEMLNESQHLVEVLREMFPEDATEDTEEA